MKLLKVLHYHELKINIHLKDIILYLDVESIMIRRLLRNRTFTGIAAGIATFILLNAFSGIIGNSTYAVFVWVWDNSIKPLANQVAAYIKIPPSQWGWILALILLMGWVISTGLQWNRIRIVSRALAIASNVVELDDSLLRLLTTLISAQDLRQEMVRLLEQLLLETIQALPGDFFRAAILLPTTSGEYLHIRVNYRMSQESINKARFYIGTDTSRNSERGVAGHTYLDRQLRVGHIRKEGHEWRSDQSEFIYFGNTHHYPSYFSYIAVPIIGLPSLPSSNPSNCLGVICFDSHNKKVFDSQAAKTVLETLSRRVAVALSIYMLLRRPPGQSI
jgi:hypothetical protein